MPIINQAASAINLARSWLMSLDRKSVNTVIPTATLEFLLNALVEIGDERNSLAMKTNESASKTVQERGGALKAALKDRDG